jgi:hypothetical protein
VEFAESARKHYAEHGISDADALHVIRNPFRRIIHVNLLQPKNYDYL